MAGLAQAQPDYYGILGVARNATLQEITSAFHKMAAEFHAAGKPANAAEVEEIRRIVTAYRVLADPGKKQEYDRYGRSLPSQELMAISASSTRSQSHRPASGSAWPKCWVRCS